MDSRNEPASQQAGGALIREIANLVELLDDMNVVRDSGNKQITLTLNNLSEQNLEISLNAQQLSYLAQAVSSGEYRIMQEINNKNRISKLANLLTQEYHNSRDIGDFIAAGIRHVFASKTNYGNELFARIRRVDFKPEMNAEETLASMLDAMLTNLGYATFQVHLGVALRRAREEIGNGQAFFGTGKWAEELDRFATESIITR